LSLKVGILGSGFMARTHAPGWQAAGAQIAGFHSAEPDVARALAGQYGVTVFDTAGDLMRAVDVVDICTPTPLHHPQALAAAAAGKAIVCEKPLARTTAQAAEIVAICERAGVPLLVGHVVRFFPEYAAAHGIVERGEVGRVAVSRFTRASFKPHADNPASWFHDLTQSGGILMDLLIHDYDVARWISGDVETVFARSVRSRAPDTPHDYALVILTHRNGALTHLEGGWAYPPPLFRTSLEIAGDRGLIEHPYGSSAPLETHWHKTGDDGAAIAVPGSPLAEDPYTTEIKEFCAVLTGALPKARVTARDGLAAVQIAEAAIESAQSGRPVRLEPLL
jgi:predicted dehydrogenase